MVFRSSIRVSTTAALGLCLVTALSGAAAPKKKETSGTPGSIRVGKPTAPAAPGKPVPKKTTENRKPAAPRPTVKAPAVKPPVVAVPAAPAIPTLYVSPDGKDPYKSISAALAKAPSGARVLVRTGIYAESLLLTRPVEISSDSHCRVESGDDAAYRRGGGTHHSL